MTWKPRKGSSNRSHGVSSEGGNTSPGFDPWTTGDPFSPRHGSPAIGFGSTRPGGFSGDAPRRHIGFAPPADDVASPRYRTEISFKRHGAHPMASVTPDDPSDDTREASAWTSPDPEVGGVEVSGEGAPAESNDGGGAVDGDLAHDDPQDTAEEDVPFESPAPEPEAVKVPFYKRELSFRRKAAVEPTPDTDSAPEDLGSLDVPAAELNADADPREAPILDDAPILGDHDVPGLEIELPLYEDAPRHEEVADELDADDLEAPLDDLAPTVTAVYELPDMEAPTLDDAASDRAAADLAAFDAADLEPADVTAFELPPLDDPTAVAGSTLAVDDDHPPTLPPLDESPSLDDVVFLPIPDDPVDEARKRRSIGRKRPGTAPSVQKRQGGRSGKGRKLVGLKIGASQLAAAVVAETDAGFELIQLARRPLASGIVLDGEVRDADALAHALKTFFDEEKLPKKDVRIGLASNRIGVRTLDIVGIEDQSQFDNAVRFKAHEVLPVAVNESLLDYRVLEERPGESGAPSRRVLLVVAPRDQVEPYQEVAERAGLRLAGIDLEALGLLRAFVDPKPFAVRTVDDTATVVVAMGHESSTLLVSGGGICEFTRVFDWGGGALQDAIAQELDVHPAEAATVLRHLSLSGPGRQFEGLDDTARARVVDAMRLRLTPFARELVSSLQFYQTQPESLGIGEIVITGGTSHLEGLAELLHQMIGVAVRVGDPLQRVIATGDIDASIESTIGSMAVPIGLAIDDGEIRHINLIAGESRKSARRSINPLAVAVPAAVAVPIAALALLFVQAHGDVSDKQSQLDAVRGQIAALPLPTTPTIDASLAGDQVARATAVANVLGGRFAWEAVFRDLTRALPTNVWLEHLTANAPVAVAPSTDPAAPAATSSAQGVTIEGFTYTQPDVARLLARLSTLPTLSNVSLQSSAAEKIGTREVVHFTVLADLVNGGS